MKKSQNQKRVSVILVAAVLALVTILSACRIPLQGPTVDEVPLTLEIGIDSITPSATSRNFANPLIPQNVLITVTGPDMETIEEIVARESAETRVSRVDLTIPAGQNRVITVLARNSNNQVLYRGSITVDLPRGETRRIAVTLEQLAGPELEAFGLSQSANPSLLDSRSGTVGTGIVDVAVSPLVSRSNLIPSFTVAEGVSVFVDGEAQTSGVSSHDFSSPVRYLLVGPEGGLSIYDVSVGYIETGAQLDFTQFGFTRVDNNDELLIDRVGAISPESLTVSVAVSDIVDRESLVADFGVPDGVTVTVDGVVQAPGETENDFSDPVDYVLYTLDGSVTRYTVTVSELPSDSPVAEEPFPFGFRKADNADSLLVDRITVAPADGGEIDLRVNDDADLSALIAFFEPPEGVVAFVGFEQQTSGVSVQDFSAPVEYRFVDADGTVALYTVAVQSLPTGLDFELSLDKTENPALIIDRDGHQYPADRRTKIEISSIVPLDALVPTFVVADDVEVRVDYLVQESGVSVVDFSKGPVTYLLYNPATGEAAEWTVWVRHLADSGDPQFETFGFPKDDSAGERLNDVLVDRFADSQALAAATDFTITVSQGVSPDGLIASFAVGQEVTVRVGSTDQVSEVTDHDFTTGVAYILANKDGDVSYITVTVMQAGSVPGFTAYSVEADENPALVAGRSVTNPSGGSVELGVSSIVPLDALVPTFAAVDDITVWIGDKEQQSGVSAVDFGGGPVTYLLYNTATGEAAEWTVAVEHLPDSGDVYFQTFGFARYAGEDLLNTLYVDRYADPAALGPESMSQDVTVTIEVADNVLDANPEGLVADFGVESGTAVRVGGIPQQPNVTPNDFSSPVVYTLAHTDGRVTDVTVEVTPKDGAEYVGEIGFGFKPGDNPGTIFFDRFIDPLPDLSENPGANAVAVPVNERAARAGTLLAPHIAVPPVSDLPGRVQAYVDFDDVTGGDNTARNFSSGVTYRFVDTDPGSPTYGDVAKYSITTSPLPNDSAIGFSKFGFEIYDSLTEAPLNADENWNPRLLADRVVEPAPGATSISVEVAEPVDTTSLIASFEVASEQPTTVWIGTEEQQSGGDPQDFSNPVTYTVAAADGRISDSTVTVSSLSESEGLFFDYFDVYGEVNEGLEKDIYGEIGEDGSITLPVLAGMELTGLIPSFGVSSRHVEALLFDPGTSTFLYQESDWTPTDFTAPVEYWLRDDATGEIASRTVTTREASSDASFALLGVIDADGNRHDTIEPHPGEDDRVYVVVPTGTDMTDLRPVFEAAAGATVYAEFFAPPGQMGAVSDGVQMAAVPPADGGLPAEPPGFGQGANVFVEVESEVTSISFTGPVQFMPVAEDGTEGTTIRADLRYGDSGPEATGAASTGIYIQNPQQGDVVLMDDFVEGSGEFHRRNLYDLGVYDAFDIDFDAFGSTYILGSEGSGRYDNHLSSYTTGADAYLPAWGQFMAIDRVRDILYTTGGWSDTVDMLLEISSGGVFPDQIAIWELTSWGDRYYATIFGDRGEGLETHGIAVDELGYVYVVTVSPPYGTFPGAYALLKINPNYGMPYIVDAVDLDEIPAFATNYTSGWVANYDLIYRDSSVYLLSDVNGGAAGVLKFAADTLGYIDAIGVPADGELDTTSGSFLGPRRFAAVLNRRIVIIDEAGTQDRLAFFDDFSGGFADNWGVLGRGGAFSDFPNAPDTFQFFSFS